MAAPPPRPSRPAPRSIRTLSHRSHLTYPRTQEQGPKPERGSLLGTESRDKAQATANSVLTTSVAYLNLDRKPRTTLPVMSPVVTGISAPPCGILRQK